jgi:tetratricopeptide (TPR) repeat protein
MRTPSIKKLKTLAQSDNHWQLVIEKMPTWITPPNEKPYRPYVLFILDLTSGMIVKSDIVERTPTANDAHDILFKAMVKPADLSELAQRPRAIGLADSQLLAELKPAFDEIDVQLIERPAPDEIRDVLQMMSASMSDGDEPPGLLSVKGATPELIGSLFKAAADFYRAEPWIMLTNLQLLGVKHPAERDYRYVCVMGNGGVEYGLGTYLKWADVEKFFSSGGNPLEALPDEGAHSFLFNEVTEVPFEDLDAIEKYGWEIVDDLYPVPMIFDLREHLTRRPSLQDLNWYEAALRAIPIFVREHLKPDGHGDYLPIEVPIEVTTHSGPIKVQVKYPGGTLSPEMRAAPGIDFGDFGDFDDEEEEDDDDLPFFDRRGMEGSMAQAVAQQFGAEEVGTGKPELDQAQQIMYQAWDESNPGKRITLAHKALSISPDCADAYVLLAEEAADTLKHAYEYYQQGVEAGRRALGEEYFKEDVGHFWGILETRPFMRALEGKANLLWNMNRYDEAIDTYNEMLRLNPGDNQGVRYSLLNLLLTTDRLDDAKRLLKKYKNEPSAVWMYTQALIEFRAKGAGPKADRALQFALEQNRFVATYLTGQKRIPNHLPDYIGIGDENEAISYASDHLNHWRRTPGAIEWLKQHAPKAIIEPKPKVLTPRRQRRSKK